jgi:cytochrome oxidase Cu insertion factor (SCO1/SenC/PrrC family)
MTAGRTIVASAAITMLCLAGAAGGDPTPRAWAVQEENPCAAQNSRAAWGALDLQAYEPIRPAPAFALPDLEGRTHRLEDLRGKTVLLFFWATW